MISKGTYDVDDGMYKDAMDWVTLVGLSNTSNCSSKYVVFYFFYHIFFACFIQFLFDIRFLTWQTLIQPEQNIFSECFMWKKDLCMEMWGHRFGILDYKVITMFLDYVFFVCLFVCCCVGDTTLRRRRKRKMENQNLLRLSENFVCKWFLVQSLSDLRPQKISNSNMASLS